MAVGAGQMKWTILPLLLLLTACSVASIPVVHQLENVRLIRYRDADGHRLIPVARSAGEAREKLWRKWVNLYENQWDNQKNQKLVGETQWCVQWIGAQQMERICRRDGGLIWFERGILRDKIAIQMADKIWQLLPR